MTQARPSFLLLLVFTIAVVAPLLASSGWVRSVSSEPVVIVVGDYSSRFSFGTLVWPGIEEAKERDRDLRVVRVEVHEDSGENIEKSIAKMKRDIIDTIARNDVVAIIGANSSRTAKSLRELADSFRIPVLYCVATADDLLTGDTYSLRMLAPDQEQTATILQWVQTQTEDDEAIVIGLLTENSVHGEGISAALREQAEDSLLLTYQLTPGPQVLDAIDQGERLGVDVWIIASYQVLAQDIVAKMYASNCTTPVLMTDGAYGDWIRTVPSSYISICFPLRKDLAGSAPHERGYACRGFDAMRLIGRAVSQPSTARRPRSEFREAIRDSVKNNSAALVGNYRFGVDGENNLAHFNVFELSNANYP